MQHRLSMAPKINRPQPSRRRYREFLEHYRNRQPDSSVPNDESSDARPTNGGPRRRAYLRLLWPHRYSVLFLTALGMVGILIALAQPLCLRYIIDHILLSRTSVPALLFRRLYIVGTIFSLLAVTYSVSKGLKQRYQAVFKARLMLSLRREMFIRLLNSPLATLWRLKVGGIQSRLTSDVDAASNLIEVASIGFLLSVMQLIFGLASLTLINWRLAVGAAFMIPPAMFLSISSSKQVHTIYGSARDDEESIDGRTAELFAGIRMVRAFGRQRFELLKYVCERNTVVRKQLFAQREESFVWLSWDLLIGTMNVGIAWYGGYLVLLGRASVGDILAFQWYTLLLLTPVSNIVDSLIQVHRSIASVERVLEVLTFEQEKPDQPFAIDAPSIVDEIVCDNIEFAYHKGHLVLRDFSVMARKGSVIALVGPSGAGKTTVTNLILRFHDPTRGRILVNGHDIRDLKVHSYRQLTAAVHQEIFLLDGSVRENIAYGRQNATDEDIEQVARWANAHEFICRLPKGYDTSVGERGVRLSGGQQQRLAIARALLADPEILILDEATSNVDGESERLIQASLETLFERRIAFVIAHRMSTVYRANLILVMKDGVVVERGDHNALIMARGEYYQMIIKQSFLKDEVEKAPSEFQINQKRDAQPIYRF
jgi:ATP-binding cassette subfamily B protein